MPVIQFFRYCTIGIVNTALDFGFYTALTRSFFFWREHYLLANALTFIFVTTWSFLWNKHWTFRERSPRHGVQYLKFFVVTFIGIGIAQGVLWAGVERFHIPDLVAKVIAAPLVVAWNFSMHRFWTFSPRVTSESGIP